jgi:magnesium transporter
MVAIILSVPEHQFEWIDITNPKQEDFTELKEKYGLKDVSIKDCLEVGHLPKIEEFDNYHFLILRSIPSVFKEESDKLTEITERVSIFYSENFIVTVHRNEIAFLEKIKSKDKKDKKLASSKSLVNSLVSEALMTFESLS